ncbi:PKD domain-containing protein [Geodermatophilaceae bacterium NBWT11]|nr:PKD domain-containing protein [Geodermatophilaceae bacterium NBWT11]
MRTTALSGTWRIAAAGVLSLLLLLGSLAGGALPARADSMPVADMTTGKTAPTTVTADALPTTQINGVVWDQAVVGNTVYVAGRFTTARPAGAAAGTSEVSRNNLLAYDLRTGVLVSSFNPNLNAQAWSLATSPDGRTLYVGGEFTRVGTATRNRIAAFDTATGALTSFAPSVSGVVKAIAATSSAVYFGGTVSAVGSTSRSRLAAVSPAGTLLPWAPVPGVGPTDGNSLPNNPTRNAQTSNEVKSIVVTGGGSQVVVAGHFYTLNNQPASGVGALDGATGATRPFAMGTIVTNQGVNSAVYSLSTDGTNVYGTGYDYYGPGNLEGSFSAAADGGALQWVNDCHGDTYSSVPFNGALYMAGHPHTCEAIGGYPEQDPRVSKYATAVSLTAEGTNAWGFNGAPAPQLLHWYPDLNVGSVSGSYQAGWDVAAAGDYLLYGGEFTRAGNTGQQGLVRFAMPTAAPNKVGPVSDAGITPTAVSVAAGSVRVSWTSAYDNDNQQLTYRVTRSDKPNAPVYETTAPSSWWNRPALGFVDRTVVAGTNYTYRVAVSDPFGNTTTRGSVTVRASSAALSDYSTRVLADGATGYWPLESLTGSTSYDYAGLSDVTVAPGLTAAAGSPTGTTSLSGDGSTAARGTAGATGARTVAPDTFSLELWFNTTTTEGGRLAGFGNAANGDNGSYDRHLYLDRLGVLRFGVYPGSVQTVSSPSALNDGRWHHVVAELSPAGQVLYVDGVRVGANSRATTGQPYTGFWQVGGGNMGGWLGSDDFEYTGQLAQVAVYPTALDTAAVRAHYTATGRTVDVVAAPTDPYGAAVAADGPTTFWRLDDAAGSGRAAGVSESGATGTYTGDVTRRTPGVSLPGTTSSAIDLDGRGGYVVADQRVANPTTFSTEVWFNTTSTQGGRIIGLGNSQDAWSQNYDRFVYMFSDGRVRFGVWAPGEAVIDSQRAYNDGDWHHVVATFGAGGMALYVDGALVGTNTNTSVDGYDGYWRLGSDNIWGGAATAAFDGQLDEAAVYDRALTQQQVSAHFAAAAQTATVAPTRPADAYGAAVYDSNPTLFWRMDDTSGSAAAAAAPAGGRGTYAGGPGLGATGPQLAGTSANRAVAFDGTDDGLYSRTPVANPTSFTTELWFSTTSTRGGKLIGFGDRQTGLSGNYDRHVYLEPSGQVSFGAYTGQTNIVTTPAAYNDGQWHQVVASMGADGMRLYVDGALVGSNGNTGAQAYTGYWRVGGDSSWSGDPYVAATIDEVAVYDRQLSATEVSTHHRASGLGPDAVPVSRFTSTVDELAVVVDGSTSADVEGPIASYAWDFGDGTTATGTPVSHRYATAGDHQVTLTVTDSKGQRATSTQTVTTTAPVPNSAPVASFTDTTDALAVSLDGTGSSDTDGAVATWAWDFGDGSTGTGATVSHTYAAEGTFVVRLTVTDDDGASTTVTRSITVTAPNEAPTAVATVTPTFLAVAADGRSSVDPDGSIASWAWEFGDGAVATGSTATHTYSGAGTYTVTLTVTDDEGATGRTTSSVTVAPQPPPNQAPTAAFTAPVTDRTVQVDGRTSTDSDGQVATWAWTFGDGASATGATASHTYTAAGTYTVTLTVTDDDGATAVLSRDVVATDPPNQAPTAGASVQGAGLDVTVDGRTSADADGRVVAWAWTFGDGASATGATASHTYAAAGTYTVTLTVTDDRGATGSTTRSVTVSPAAPAVLASDAFGRTVTGGLGQADTGGAWVASYGAARLSVTPGVAQLALTSPTNQTGAYLAGVSSTAVDLRTSVALSGPVTGGGTTVYVAGRRVGLNQEYRLRLRFQSNGAVGVAVTRLAGSATETLIGGEVTLPGRYTAGQVLQVDLRVSGSGTTTVSGSVWADGATAPVTPTVTRTDTTASLQAPGSVGLTAYLSGSATNGTVARFGALTVTELR